MEPRDESAPDRRSYSRRDFLRGTIGGAAAVGVGGLLGACGSNSSTPTTSPSPSAAGKPVRGGTLRLGCTGGGSSDTLDVQAGVNTVDFARSPQISNCLYEWNYDAVAVPALATLVEPNSDASVWTIHLRQGVLFHNGKEMTSEDVIYSLRRIADPKLGLAGASGIASLDMSTIKADGKYTVIAPCKPGLKFSVLPDNLTGWGEMSIIPAEGYNPQKPIGTGAFKYESFSPGVESVFSRFDNYWQDGADGKPLPYLDSVRIYDVADETAQVDGLTGGSFDCIDLLSYGSIATIRSSGQLVNVSDGGGWVPFTMRIDVPPFNDNNVRQAMRWLVDRPEMRLQVFGGYGLIGNDVFGIVDPDYPVFPQREQDIPRAKSLLAKAGVSKLNVTLVTSDIHEGAIPSATVLKTQAAQAGVTVNLNTVTPTAFFGKQYLSWTFAQDWWSANHYLRQVSYSELPTSPWNETHWASPAANPQPAGTGQRYLNLYTQALSTVNDGVRKEIIHEMGQLDYEYGGYIIPYFSPVISGYGKNLVGVVSTNTGDSLSEYLFKNFWFKK
ncbi:MAG: ABC transporter substrate-binding protein [Acidimicrobiales bacterium]